MTDRPSIQAATEGASRTVTVSLRQIYVVTGDDYHYNEVIAAYVDREKADQRAIAEFGNYKAGASVCPVWLDE